VTADRTNAATAPRTLLGAARDFFRFGSPRLLGAQVTAALGARVLFGSPGIGDLVVAGAVAVYWPLQEWVLHRYVLHAKGSFAAARTHRRHHADVFDQAAAVLPAPLIALLIPIHVGLWWTLAPTKAMAATGIATLGGAALAYEWIHFLTHTAYRPRSAWFREVRTRHMWHHQRDSKRWFGFVVPRLDDWLGTGGR
jgi:sterol desaturase/sphingolipid hydroxylase (fatty acid hydroxylase superfamily)